MTNGMHALRTLEDDKKTKLLSAQSAPKLGPGPSWLRHHGRTHLEDQDLLDVVAHLLAVTPHEARHAAVHPRHVEPHLLVVEHGHS